MTADPSPALKNLLEAAYRSVVAEAGPEGIDIDTAIPLARERVKRMLTPELRQELAEREADRIGEQQFRAAGLNVTPIRKN